MVLTSLVGCASRRAHRRRAWVALVGLAAASGCIALPPLAELRAREFGSAETPDQKPAKFYAASWADSSDPKGEGGTRLTASEGRKTLPLRGDNFNRNLIGDLSTTKHANWVVFHSQRSGEGRALSLEWKRTTTLGEEFADRTWAGAGIAFDSSWNNLDVSGAKVLVIYAKACRDDLDGLDVSVRLRASSSAKGQENTTSVSLMQFVDGNKIGTSWTRIAVPLRAFPDLDRVDIGKLRSIELELGGKYPDNQQLWIHIDDVYFSDVELLTPVDNLGYALFKDEVILLWDEESAETVGSFAVKVDDQPAVNLRGTDRWFANPRSSLAAHVPHRATIVASNAEQTTAARSLDIVVLDAPGESAIVRVDAESGHEVSPYIFGANAANPMIVKELGATVNRWGGARASTYNWQNDAENKGVDGFFANSDSRPANAPETEKRYYRFITESVAAGAAVNVTIPIGPYLANASSPGNRLCSFPTLLYPEQEKTDGQGCGNGLLGTSREPIWGNDPGLAYVPNSADVQRGFVEQIGKAFDAAGGKGRRFYTLDHEPGLWRVAHRDIAPKGLSTDQLVALNVTYASVVKSVDADAVVIGFAGFGPAELGASNADFTPPGEDGYRRYDKFKRGEPRWSDRRAHGDAPQIASFLQGIKKAEVEAGKRLIDIIDVHWYPQCYGRGADGTKRRLSDDLAYDDALAVEQFDALREWYDGSYVAEESWMTTGAMKKILWDPFHPVLPALKKIIETNDPGLKLAINEFAVGSPDHFHGALLRAAILGIFMQEDVYMAGAPGPGDSRQPAYWAQRLYGNYDGNGAKVRGRFVRSQASHRDLMSFAVRDAGRTQVVLVNKNRRIPLEIRLELPHDVRGYTTYELSEHVGRRIFAGEMLPVAGSAITVHAPPYAALLIVAE